MAILLKWMLFIVETASILPYGMIWTEYENVGERVMENSRREMTREEKRRRMEQRKLRKKRARRRRLAFLGLQCVIIGAIVFLLWDIKEEIGKNKEVFAGEAEVVPNETGMSRSSGQDGMESGDYAQKVGLVSVDRPVKRSEEEVLAYLEELAQESAEIRAILNQQESYPPNMLEALANNPEMADFVAGYLKADGSVQGGLTDRELAEEHPLFLQWDPRWGYVSYGDDSNVGLAGCGPTCLSMALYELTGDASLTPDVIAEYSMENGYYMSGTGTLWALMEDVPGQHGVSVEHPGLSEAAMKECLDHGQVLICAMRPGDFTAAGHFIVIYDYNRDGFLVNDPNCVARSRRSWTFEQIGGQIKQVWALGKQG